MTRSHMILVVGILLALNLILLVGIVPALCSCRSEHGQEAPVATADQPDPGVRPARPALAGEPPSAIYPPSGCGFRARCPAAQPVCETPPPLVTLGRGHVATCHFPGSPDSSPMDP